MPCGAPKSELLCSPGLNALNPHHRALQVKQMEHKIANGELPSLGSSIFTFDDDSTELLCDSSSVEEQLEAALQVSPVGGKVSIVPADTVSRIA